MTLYLTVDDVRAIHLDLIVRYGGTPGLRDRGLLEAAVSRPRSGYYHDLIAEAAAIWESLAQNHAFVDGNKRVGFAATYTFLALNGVEIIADPDDAFRFIDQLYVDGRFVVEELDFWLRNNVRAT